MADSLPAALESLRLTSRSFDDDIDELLDQAKPRKRVRQTSEEVKTELEKRFLTPSTSFSPEWLDRLQQRWDTPTNYNELFAIGPTQTRTIIRFTREGLEGRVTGYKEVTVPANSATAKNSTSILRKPASRADFVRGAAGFYPFAPGGLDAVEATAAYEDELLQKKQPNGAGKVDKLSRVINFAAEGGLLTVPPGFTRGLRISEKPQQNDEKDDEKEVEDVLEEESDLPDGMNGVPLPKEDADDEDEVSDHGEDELDALLPVEFPALAPHGPLASARNKHGGRERAHMVDVNRDITNFSELVPEMARTWPFELDTFQKEAVYHLENGDSVFVAAHTSAGKTVVAEYAIALAQKHMTKAIYTSPIKALSNQKFRDFRLEFDDVGILTGDVQIRPEASCLIMTTEILRSMLYRGADLIRDVEFVIFDEVHYVNDSERGVVWEEVIIMLPEHVTLIMLSATVPNTYEFASWVGRTKQKDIYVISTPKRPVPLEHYLWADKKMFKIVDSAKHFIEKGWKDANDALSGRDKLIEAEKKAKEKEDAAIAAGRGGRGGGAAGRGQNQRGGQPRGGGPQRGASQQRGRGQPAARGHGNIARTGRGGGRTTAAQDRNIWVHLVQHLRKEDLLPGCIFVFSKKRCEENADALSTLDYCTSTEKSAVHMILEKSLARLKPDDRQLPQIRRMRELLSRGIAVHHGGLLPIVKECVEILFAKTLVKVLFATETFAMGLNLPTRTVVFSGFRKYDNKSFRDLLPGEYTQMAGRAGRRGLDSVGSVIIVAPGADEAPPAGRLRQMMLGDPTKLRSQFRLTYNMILNLLRVEALKIEEMIKRSFSENATQALLPEHEKQIKLSEADLAKVTREACDICDKDIEACQQASIDYQRLTADLHLAMLGTPVGRRMFQPKRIIVFKGRDNVRTAGVLLREGASKASPPTVQVLEVFSSKPRKRQDPDFLPYLPRLRRFFVPLPQTEGEIELRTITIQLDDIEALTATHVAMDLGGVLQKEPDALAAVKTELLATCSSWTSSSWNELDYYKWLKDMNVRNIMDARAKAASTAQDRECIHCGNFPKHFAMAHDQWVIRDKIDSIRMLMSDQNLQLLPDYEQRICVLKELGFIDDHTRVELKGKVACEIHSADELVLTELVLENVLADYEPEEIVALLSSFVFQEKTDITPNMTPALERGIETIIKISEKVNKFQTLHQVILASDDSNDFVSRPRFGLVEVVYEWARGMPFSRITDLTDVLEGTIVRVITRLDETCREVKNAARIIGDPTLFTKMQTCQELIKRDICATASLYM
ncbi:probable cytoplasmic exosomal RNA helicase SKI2, DEAD-box superfamily [Ramularia collo-cygni]|uniref:Probable cytoplasmic exosomal RNA helicase SKI2, DEAD-box superfamily n=1 Tax=Ramularia collo-cygni TaxID=112498 RepID=A0A2D3V3P2_9PEZI|nr:probable cytoplasmic exosomal RNA helicase SKI2, DEAD-box superfamily [Ramularia collo-cygni]CZT16119.1 probable cytoplasmic exosomal RNA helicase SKI2, DEAD-box superfamily [Ramularia collo-cygni]